MNHYSALRLRLWTVVGLGAATTLTQCGGSSESNGVDGQAGGSDSAGSSAAGTGGAAAGSAGAGSTAAGGNAGFAGVLVTMCPPQMTVCRTREELAECSMPIDAGVAGGTSTGGAEGQAGADAEAACPDPSTARTCFTGIIYSPTGPTEQNGQCCYVLNMPCGVGRPFTVHGAPRAAEPAARGDWCAEIERDSSLSDTLREQLRQAWLDDALLEHASIASFARLTLELLAVGAPPDLVRDSQRAALDEVRHARHCFALAARYGNVAGPGTLNMTSALEGTDLLTLAVRSVEEGCVGETLGALLVREQAAGALDARLKSTLEAIADDEARHAELAWRIVRWAIERGGEPVRLAVDRAFRRSLAAATRAGRPASGDPAWNAHGRLDGEQARAISERAVREVIAPCAAGLLAGGVSGASPFAG